MASDNKVQGDVEMGYQHTLMYGRYTRSLGEYAREHAKQLREAEKQRKYDENKGTEELRKYRGKCASMLIDWIGLVWRNTFAKIGEDWVFLALLGIIMALISFVMDYGISQCNTARIYLYRDLYPDNAAVQYLAWICLPVFLVLFSAGFVHLLAPQAIGSGIPEMKTILRGVVLKEYLTFRTLIGKTVGLTAALGSGMPLGKEGPLVHIASIVATLMSKLVTSFKGIYENESRNSEMLAAACAVGVSCCFAAPIGGVLFSIEVTSVYFAIRNYWRGFFSAVFGALMFRLLAYWFTKEETITAVFKTQYQVDFPYDPQELFIYALVGAFGGLSGALFVWCHRKYVLFMRKNKKISSFLQKNRFLYPGIVSLVIASVYFPLGLGQYLASTLTTQQQIISLFSNFTWSRSDLTVRERETVGYWMSDNSEVATLFINLGIFIFTTFLLTILASTLPVPSGSLIPVFKMGAAFGRMVGEAMHLWFPEGVRLGTTASTILPGGYAIVGAAAFSAGVTHSISICVVISEMTGQIRHIVPVMIAVLVSNAISTLLQPSLYDSIIMIKKLPYLPDILPNSSGAYRIYVEDFMLRNIKYIWNGMTYTQLKQTIKDGRKVRSFPLVDNPKSMILLGSIQRTELINLIEKHIGRQRREQLHADAMASRLAKFREETQAKLQLALPSVNKPADRADAAKMVADKEAVQRRPSRFEVVPATDVLRQTELQISPASGEMSPVVSPGSPGSDNPFQHNLGPRKSILKKTNSFIFKHSGPMHSPMITPYSTVTGAEGSKIRQAIDAIFRRSSTMLDSNNSKYDLTSGGGGGGGGGASSAPTSPSSLKRVTLPMDRLPEMSPEERKEWEESEMSKCVNLQASCQIDPAPFQLVERTSLLKVHSMFSLLGVNHAYVTGIGKLMGIVSLKELRKAIEDVNSGILPASHSHFSAGGADLRQARDASPGAPEDIETGPDPPGFDDDDSDSDDHHHHVRRRPSILNAQFQPVTAETVCQVPVGEPAAVTVVNDPGVSVINTHDNRIKLIITSAPREHVDP